MLSSSPTPIDEAIAQSTPSGLALVQLGRDAEARGLFRQGYPAKSELRVSLAWLHLRLAMVGQLDEARRALQRTMDLDPAFSLDSITARLGFSEKVRQARLFEGWRRAGVQKTL